MLSILRGIIRKDSYLLGQVTLIYGLPLLGVFLLTMLVPDWRWFFPPEGGISQSSLAFSVVASMNTLFIPFVLYLLSIHAEKQYGSFIVWRALPITPRLLLWGHVLSCWVFSSWMTLVLALLFNVLHALGVLAEDRLAPLLLGIRFPLLLIAASLLTSAIAVGLGMNASSLFFSLLVIGVSTPIVLSSIFLALVFDVRLEALVVRFVRMFGTSLRLSLLLVGLALLWGEVSCWLFSRKRSYV